MKKNKIYKLESYGILKIAGIDAKKFLQGQLTCDTDKIPATGRLAAHCNPQGRVISLFFIAKTNDEFMLCMPRELISITESALKKYAIFYKVSITNESDNLNIAVIKDDSNLPISTASISTLGIKLIITQESIPSDNVNEWQLQLIQLKIPVIYSETSGKFLPQELNLIDLGAIDFDKGCYTGQEIIARMHYRGKSKNRLYQAKISGKSFVLGDDIVFKDGHQLKAAGQIVNYAKLNDNTYAALVSANPQEINHNLFINTEETIISIINEREI